METRDAFKKLALGLALVMVLFWGTASATTIKDYGPAVTGASAPILANTAAAVFSKGNQSPRFWITMSSGSGMYNADAQAGLGTMGVGSIALFDCLSLLSFLETGNLTFYFEGAPGGVASAVPEPGTFILLAAGIPGIAWLRRKIR